SADANQLLTELRFLVCFALNRFARRRQRPGRLGSRRPQGVDPGEDGLPLARQGGPLRRPALDLVRCSKGRLAFLVEGILGIADPRLDLEKRVRCFATAIGNGADDFTGRRPRPELGMVAYGARSRRS